MKREKALQNEEELKEREETHTDVNAKKNHVQKNDTDKNVKKKNRKNKRGEV